MQTTRPLFQFDPGWLFVLAGLGVCAAGVLLPAQTDLEALQRQVAQLRSEEVQAYARLKAHADFMDQMDQANPGLIRRLAAAQLNIVPEGDTPVLLSNADTSPVTSWIDSTVQVDIRPPKAIPSSQLSRLANGPNRLWMFGGGIMAVFVGLMLSPTPPILRRESVEEWDESTYGDDDDQAVAVLEPLDESVEPAETKALLELLETDEAVDVAAAALMDDLSLGEASDLSVRASEPETLDSFELEGGVSPQAIMAAADESCHDQPSPPSEAQASAEGDSPDPAHDETKRTESDDESSFGGCLTIAEDHAVEDDSADVLQRDVEPYAGIEGDDGYDFEDMDGELSDDVPEADDDDGDEDGDDEDDSNSSYGSNPFRR